MSSRSSSRPQSRIDNFSKQHSRSDNFSKVQPRHDNITKKNKEEYKGRNDAPEKQSKIIIIINIILKILILILIIYTIWMNNKILNTTSTPASTSSS